MTAATYISISTLAVATTLIALTIRSWWRAGKSFKIIFHGFAGIILGATLAICAGGLLGDIASWVAGGSNSVAGTVIPWGTGTGDRNLASAGTAGLGIEGGAVSVVVLALGLVTVRAAAKEAKRRMVGGTFVGICLTYTAGVAGMVTAYLIPAYNSTGHNLVAFVEGSL